MSTLFVYIQLVVDQLQHYGLEASYSFVECADKQLTKQFIDETGIKPGKNVSISIGAHVPGRPIYSTDPESGKIDKIFLNLFINYNWNPVTIRWRGDYQPTSIITDCNDLDIFFESLDPALYFRQLYPESKLPFKLDDLPYQLVVSRLNKDCELTLDYKPGCEVSKIINDVDLFIAHYNKKSEKKYPSQLTLHSWVNEDIATGSLVLSLDMGSIAMSFLKSLLKEFAKMNVFERVEIG